MRSVNEDLRRYVEENILPLYDNFDKAHRRDHADKVISESLNLATHYDVDIDMVYVIAAYHDLGLCNGRERHHIDSGTILLDDANLRAWFDEDSLMTMKEAVEDHRASGKDEPRSIYGKIVSEADRNIDPETIIRRTIQFSFAHYPDMSKEEHFARLCGHLEKKYSERGYLRLWIPYSGNAARLKELRSVINDPQRLRAEFDRIYDAEKQS